MSYGLLLFITVVAVAMHTCLAADVDCKKYPARIDRATCCSMPKLISKEIKDKCKEYMTSPSPKSGEMADSKRQHFPTSSFGQRYYHRKLRGIPSCFFSCVLNETEIINVMDAKLNEDKLAAYLKVVLKDGTVFIPVVETSFITCSAKAEQFHAKMEEKSENRPTLTSSLSTNMSQDRMTGLNRCPDFAKRLMGCVFKESFMNCPTSKWSNTKKCNEMRDHMKNCKAMDGNTRSIKDSNSNSTEAKI